MLILTVALVLTVAVVGGLILAALLVGVLVDWVAGVRAGRRQRRGRHERGRHRFVHGRVWTWRSGDLYTHDDTLSFPRAFIDEKLGLPSPSLADNPNYSKLCGICRSEWPGVPS